MQKTIPIIDIFAGPGGLGEGFSRYDRDIRFKIALSIEKDEHAHKTLELRSFYRQFNKAPDNYYDYVCGGKITREKLFTDYPMEAEAARHEAWCAELGSDDFPDAQIDKRIRAALGGQEDWILIGGPPCQAYSLVGRSRMISTHPDFEKDHRHVLYREYLRIIKKHKPQIFVMENVKGLLTSKYQGDLIFEKIRRDLSYPWGANSREGYDIYSLSAESSDPELLRPGEFVVKSENYGIPQARHRVILLGVRRGSKLMPPAILSLGEEVHVRDVIADLPPLRSRVSSKDSYKKWKQAQKKLKTIAERNKSFNERFKSLIARALQEDAPDFSGAVYIKKKSIPSVLEWWYSDSRLPGVLNHEARSHMESDLTRYLFATCFTEIHKRSPKLTEYPRALLPNHKNARDRKKIKAFADRFRVQRWDAPSTTIVSHIAKDGHYYIHPDPVQCRALTVREAARLQTFPDNYFFEGNRTHQYTQVGNAVPPYLAHQIAGIVAEVLLSSSADNRKVAASG